MVDASGEPGDRTEQRQHRAERRGSQRGAAKAALTTRAIALGCTLVALVAVVTPYNDDVLRNSPFIGNHFPIGIVTLMALLILAVNPMLMMFGKRALGTGEMVLIMTMMLVGSAVPSSGLMRYLEPMLISPFWLARDYPWLKPIANLLPAWAVPTKDATSAIVSNYWLGIDPVRGESVPVLAFLLPLAVWGILIAAILGAALFLAAIFRKQWVFHERLTFPLATIPLELLAAPEQGRWLNRLWRNPLLGAGAAIPVLVYLFAGLHDQFPAVPYIDLHYDFHEAFTDRPWDALPTYLSSARLYLSAVGISFFIPSEIGFTLWLFIVANGLVRVMFAKSSIDPGQHEATRGMGIYLGYFAGLVWLARGHLRRVAVAAWRRTPREEGEPASYRTMLVGWTLCMLVAWGWLIAVGMTPAIGAVLLALGTVLVLLMARVVAETGLFFVGPMWWPTGFVSSLLGPQVVSTASFYWTQIVSRIFFADLRETLMPFAVNSLRMGQEVADRERGRWFRWLFVALGISVLLSGATHHYLSYTHGRTALEDGYASSQMPFDAMQETYTFANTTPQESVSGSWVSFGMGAVMVGVLMVGRVMWVSWPFHPIGLVLMNSGPLQAFWFSIFIGWGVKRLLLRYGGAGAFRRARPFFIGLIVGEILSAGAWLIVGFASHGAVRYTLFPG